MKADLILTADWHLRETPPVTWTGDFFQSMEDSISFVRDLQDEHNCPIAVAGDVFDKWNSSLFLIAWAIQNVPGELISIPGQHDLPQHNLNKINRTALNILQEAGNTTILTGREPYERFIPNPFTIYGFPWGIPLKGKRRAIEGRKIALCHVMTFLKKKPFPGCTSDNAGTLMEKMAGFDLIVTGDNHQPFTKKIGDRLLVNPGSLLRLTAGQIDHRPRVYLWYAEENEVEEVYLPIKKNQLSREHIDLKDDHDERIEAFVSRLKEDVEIGLSFTENLKEFMNVEKTNKAVKDMVWEMIG